VYDLRLGSGQRGHNKASMSWCGPCRLREHPLHVDTFVFGLPSKEVNRRLVRNRRRLAGTGTIDCMS
jgi:hypothetical protein